MSAPTQRRRRQRGFTLVELLAVLVVIGIALGMVSLKAAPSQAQALQGEAQRIALLLQLARDEAIVRNRQVAFEADPERYRFLVRDERQWQAVTDSDLLRERAFQRAPVAISIDPPSLVTSQHFRLIFGREPVDKPFVLTLASGDSQVAIRADGIGHFTVD